MNSVNQYAENRETIKQKMNRKGKTMSREPLEYYTMYWEAAGWWRYAGAEARKSFIDELNECGILYESAGWKSYSRKVEMKFAVDYSNIPERVGCVCVYVYATLRGEIFYIGEGDIGRACTINNRSATFQMRAKENGYRAFLLCLGTRKEIARKIETMCIYRAQIKGCQLFNTVKTLNPTEVECFAEKEKDHGRYFSEEVEQKYKQYQDYKTRYLDILNAFDELTKFCTEVLSPNYSGVPEDKTIARAVLHMWTIDGVSKSGAEWCREYNVNLSAVVKRMQVYGCTPKEAMCFPPVENKKMARRDAVKYWNSIGLSPGTDTSSYVTPLNEWPLEYGIRFGVTA